MLRVKLVRTLYRSFWGSTGRMLPTPEYFVLINETFKDKTGSQFQIFYCLRFLGRKKFLYEGKLTLEFFPSFWVFIYLHVGKHGCLMESGLRPHIIEANHIESPHVTRCGTD